eukprot:TRINITY_DN6534_c0_g3_i1.p1 TRINITY_DN6534_c0_g3~~TRINITY_DN6534_c0_g3_i1.p1  ORF type:complete len:1400 (-),score=473.90 TRINITY_DN6534_c0_g3_i1:115-4203(-)
MGPMKAMKAMKKASSMKAMKAMKAAMKAKKAMKGRKVKDEEDEEDEDEEEEEDEDEEEEEVKLPTKKGRGQKRKGKGKKKKGKKSKKGKGKDDDDDDDDDEGEFGGSTVTKRGKKSIEQQYKKVTATKHILMRPDTYVGSIEKQEDDMWVFDEKKSEMDHRKVSYVPGLYKIFDEILVNAGDNLTRDPKMNAIKVDIDRKKGRIKVWNNGKGLPIQIHKKHKVYVPELVFGHLLTSDNYDDNEKKVTGGRNGFGAKLTNIFSKQFVVETCANGKRYRQEWTANMSKKGKPQIKKHTGESYTAVEFWPDLKRFGMKELESDTIALMMRRVWDMAGTSGTRCAVSLNGKKLPVKTFADYCSYYHGGEGHAFVEVGKRWQVLVSTTGGDGFEHLSYVNHISTPKGGTHVDYITNQLVDAVKARAKKQNKGGPEVKTVHVKSHLWVFINSLIVNPAFSSQTKEQLTLKASQFGSTCSLPKSFIDQLCSETSIVDAVVSEAQAKMTAGLDKDISSSSRGKRVLGVPKLEDANDAGGKEASECTLILTEGDSAKALAIAGLSVIGRDKYGVFPLRGKLLNVRDANQKQVSENKEIMNLCKILGLTFSQKNVKMSDLRYGSVMIMADQDHDGSHIKGLLINFFHHWWPGLLTKNDGFLQEFVTPIVKVTKGADVKQFFTQVEYEKWRSKNGSDRGWKVKYYKGLGTSTAAEAKEYFKAIDEHSLEFAWKGMKDGKLIDMAFNKAKADDRKHWMNKYVQGSFVDHSKDKLSYTDFINKELVQFARYDLMRSVPSIVDGLKPTQRKVLYCTFKRNLKNDVKVAQLVGYVSEHAAYHHGEASLAGTIVGMAQDFVGSNNLNLLVPSGQFGTRLLGGKDAASSRYIYTRLSPLTRLVFSPLDDAILEYQEEDGQRIEPLWYVPVIPMILVNGAEGIGTGWSTSVPNYDPREIIANMRLYANKKKMKNMNPWYRGFTGSIKPMNGRENKGKYDCNGVYQLDGRCMQITELPLRKWTQDYKEFLQSQMPGGDGRKKVQIQDIREYHTENRVHFLVRVDHSDRWKTVKDEGVEAGMRLRNTLSETNMVLYNHKGQIQKYKTPLEIMQEFGKLRLKFYDIRKKYLISKLTIERDLLYNRARFIGMIIAKKLHINNRKKKDIVKDLVRLKFKKFGDTREPRTGYEYLLCMQIASLTLERKLELEKMLKEKETDLKTLKKTTIKAMWLRDLDILEAHITELYKDDATAADALAGTGKKGPKDPKKSKKRKLDADDDGDDEDWAAGVLKNAEVEGKGKAKGKGKKLKIWKGAKGKKMLKRPAAADDDDEEEGEGGEGDDEEGEAKAIDSLDNIFGDTNRWTSGLIKGVAGLGLTKGKSRY